MTILKLQQELIEEINKIFDGMTFNTLSGERKALNVFEQELPEIETDDEDEENVTVPYCIVKVESGNFKQSEESNCNVVFVFGFFDNDKSHSGYKDVLIAFEKVRQRFQKQPCINCFECDSNSFQFVMTDDDYYPYFFGAIQMSFKIPNIERENSLVFN